MDTYRNYEVEDFLNDESFMTWVLTASPEQTEFWEDWLEKNPDRKPMALRARNILLSLRVTPAATSLTEEELSTMADNIRQRLKGEKHTPILLRLARSPWVRVAAVLLIVFTAAGLLLRQKNIKKAVIASTEVNPVINYVNNDEHPKVIRLNDGSLVILNPHSTLKYPRTFNVKERKVELEGEAFFEVHKNPQQPFLVYTNSIITRVLGTSFTVRAFPGEEAKVVVNTGRVQVTNRDDRHEVSSTVVLLPNEEVTVGKGQGHLQKDSLQVPLLLSQPVAVRVFSFDNAPLSQIVEKLEEAYHVSINYDHQKYANATVTASLGNLPLDEKIKMICKAIDAQCDFSDGGITIK